MLFHEQQEAHNYVAKLSAPFLHLCRVSTVLCAPFMRHNIGQLFSCTSCNTKNCACIAGSVDTDAIHHLELPAKCLCCVLFAYAYTLFKIYLITHLVTKHARTAWKGMVQAAGVCSCARPNVWSSSECTEAFSATNFTAF